MADLTQIFGPDGFDPALYEIPVFDRYEAIAEFTRVLEINGNLIFGFAVADGQIHRLKHVDDKHRAKTSWYVLYDGGHCLTGCFGNWKNPDMRQVWSSFNPDQMTHQQREDFAITLEEAKVRQEAERKRVQDEVAVQCYGEWESYPPAPESHHYLVTKRVKPVHGVKTDGGVNIVIPLMNEAGEFRSYQTINFDGKKRFPSGGEKRGCFFIIPGSLSLVLVAEGYSTGYSLYEASGATVYIAFDAGNMPSVTAIAKRHYPHAKLIVCADNDRFTKNNKDEPINTGVIAANKAKEATGPSTLVAIPQFPESDTESSDFNDLHVRYGIEKVAECLETSRSTYEVQGNKHEAIIEAVFANLNEDIAAWDTQEFIGALSNIQSHDSQQYRRIYEKLKTWKIATEVDKKVKAFINLRRNTQKISRAYLTQALEISQLANKPKVQENALVQFNPETGEANLVIESEGASTIAQALRWHWGFSEKAKTWHRFTGTHWEAQESHQVDAVLIELLYEGAASTGFRNAYRNNIKSLIADSGCLSIPQSNRNIMPFKNGLLNTQALVLHSITPETAQTWCFPYDYNPATDCPNIKAWLSTAVDHDKETVEFLRAWLAALLHGRSDLQKFLHLIGSGGTGKGVFIRLASALVGEHNTVSTTLKEMEQNRFESARFYGKRLIKITDSNRYGGGIDTFKALTGQDVIRLERKHQQQSGGFVFEGMVIMASNCQRRLKIDPF